MARGEMSVERAPNRACRLVLILGGSKVAIHGRFPADETRPRGVVNNARDELENKDLEQSWQTVTWRR